MEDERPVAIRPVRILGPEWINTHHGRSYTTEVLAGYVVVGGERFTFEGDAPPDGKVMRVMFGRRFQAEPLEVHHRRLVTRTYNRRVEKERRQEMLRRRRSRALQANMALFIPVKWGVANKPVLSGLTRNSNGDGLNRRSVGHVRVQEPMADGTLKRDAGQLLCGNAGSFDTVDACETRVTCKRCLKVAERWSQG